MCVSQQRYMTSHRLIGITGHIGSGKTTASNYLTSKYFYKEKSFADPLKKICKELFLFTDDQVYGTQDQKASSDPNWFGCSPRTAMQFVGTELFRNQLDKIMPGLKFDVFIHHFRLFFESTQDSIVVPDIRFENEAKIIKDLGGIIIRINRKSSDIVNYTHQSETELDNLQTDYVIDNNGSMEELYVMLDMIVRVLGNVK